MLQTPFYDPNLSYEDNWKKGPFGAFKKPEKIQEKGEPKYEIFGHKIYTPFGIPAGPLLNGRFIKAALDTGFDIPVHKTVRTRVLKSNPWPNVVQIDIKGDLTPKKIKEGVKLKTSFAEPLSITNSFGNPSYDPNFWQKDLSEAVRYAKKGQMVGGSYEGRDWEGKGTKAFIDDWVLGAKLLNETGVAFIEMNFSCPNEGFTSLLCFDSAKCAIIADKVRNKIGNTPLVAKMPYFENDDHLFDFVSKMAKIVDGFAFINTIQTKVFGKNGKQGLPGPNRLFAGICGAAIKWAGLDMTRRMKKIRERVKKNYTIIGMGGVMNVKDYMEYRAAGADVVMSATGSMWNPHLATEIKSSSRV